MNAAQRSELETLARALMKEHEIPGVAIGILEGHDEAIVTLGSAGDDPPRDVGPSTIFKFGSVTKTFTALGLMRKERAAMGRGYREIETEGEVRRPRTVQIASLTLYPRLA